MFLGNTRIRLADGTEKRIDALSEGDRVVGITGEHNKIRSISKRTLDGAPLFHFGNGRLWTTWDRPFLQLDGRWSVIDLSAARDAGYEMPLVKMTKASRLVNVGNPPVWAGPLIAHDQDPEMVVYGLELDGDHTYIAEGFVAHNPPDYYENSLNNIPGYSYSDWVRGGQPGSVRTGINPATGGLEVIPPGGFAPPAPPGSDAAGVGSMAYPGNDVEDAWIPGVNEATDIYNQGQLPLDPNDYLGTTMQNLMAMQNPQANPYLDEMLAKGQRSIADQALSSMGLSGRGMSFDPENGQMNDQALRFINEQGDFTSQFLGSQYQQDMNRALQAQLGGGDFISSTLQMQQDQPWNNLMNYANVTSSLTGSSPQQQEDPQTSGWDRLVGGASIAGSILSIPGVL